MVNIKREDHKIGLYIHIPFCKYICTYCDFCKKKIEKYDTLKYINILIKDLKKYEKYMNQVDTIYIGGGTPSAVNKVHIKILLQYIKMKINLKKIKEYTIEANPDDIKNEEDVLFYEDFGINRVSLGVQTINDNILKSINREHNFEQVQNAINLLNTVKMNVNIDLMFNLPKQTMRDIDNTFEFIKKNKIKINHISYYSLILEENTVLSNQMFNNFTEDEEDYVYKKIQKELEQLGFFQYEISNYSKKGYESIHNLKYWEGKKYIGSGLGASGYLKNKRYTITKSYNDYIIAVEKNEKSRYYFEEEYITNKDLVEEKVMLGLRMNKGIKIQYFEENNITINDMYMEKSGDFVKIKPKYLFLSNQIIINILEQL